MAFMSKNLPALKFNPVDQSVIRGFTTKVPDVTGLAAAKALKLLSDAGFTPQLAPTRAVCPSGGDRGPHQPAGRLVRRQRRDDHRVRQQRQTTADTVTDPPSDDQPVADHHASAADPLTAPYPEVTGR